MSREKAEELAKLRYEAQKKNDFKTSDSLRYRINDLGYAVTDGKNGYRLNRIERVVIGQIKDLQSQLTEAQAELERVRGALEGLLDQSRFILANTRFFPRRAGVSTLRDRIFDAQIALKVKPCPAELKGE